MQINANRRKRHRRTDLQKAAHPAIRQINFDFFVIGFGGGFHLESGRIDVQRGFLVFADFLKFLIQFRRIINVRRAALEFVDFLEDVVIATQAAIGRLVTAETFEKKLVRMHRNHRVEDDPRLDVALVKILEIFALCPVERLHNQIFVFAQGFEFGVDRAEAGFDISRSRHHLRQPAFFLLRRPRFVIGLVFRRETQIRHHHVMQRRHRLAERQMLAEFADEKSWFAEDIRRERHPDFPRRAGDG